MVSPPHNSVGRCKHKTLGFWPLSHSKWIESRLCMPSTTGPKWICLLLCSLMYERPKQLHCQLQDVPVVGPSCPRDSLDSTRTEDTLLLFSALANHKSPGFQTDLVCTQYNSLSFTSVIFQPDFQKHFRVKLHEPLFCPEYIHALLSSKAGIIAPVHHLAAQTLVVAQGRRVWTRVCSWRRSRTTSLGSGSCKNIFVVTATSEQSCDFLRLMGASQRPHYYYYHCYNQYLILIRDYRGLAAPWGTRR